MIFNKIRLVGYSNIDLPINGLLTTEPYVLKEADGLGPPEVDVFITANANTDQGGKYQGRRPQNRVITLRIGLNPDFSSGQTASDLRKALYGLLTKQTVYGNNDYLFGDRMDVQLFQDATQLMHIYGYVNKIEVVPWSQDPEVQITIMCASTFFTTIGSTVATSFPMTNVGTAATGFGMNLTCTSAQTVLTIGEDGGATDVMSFAHAFAVGDTVYINTDPTDNVRSAYLNPVGGGQINLLPFIVLPFNWLQLYAGVDTIATHVSPGFTINSVIYRPKYWGV